ncbi:unnamed protein product [[Candida] boidinii]|nr:unnamed protein product [[Candida] boidinii]
MRNLKKIKHGETGEFVVGAFEKNPNSSKYPEFYQLIANPISFHDIKIKIKQTKYDSVNPFVEDVFLLIQNYKTYYASNPLRLSVVTLLEQSFNKYLTDELRKPDDFYLDSAHQGRFPLDKVEWSGKIYKVGNWVLITNPNDERKPIIGQIFRIWSVPEESDQKYINVCWYFRSEWTAHRYDRIFLKNEVFKTGQYRDHKIEEIIGPCHVAYYTRWLKGDPIDFEGPMFICEYRYNDSDKNFNKIRTWRACLPDEVRDHEDPIELLSEPRVVVKYESPIKDLLPEGASDSDPFPESVMKHENAPPLVGGVYYRTPRLSDDPNQYSTIPAKDTLPLPDPVEGEPRPVRSFIAGVSLPRALPLNETGANGSTIPGTNLNGTVGSTSLPASQSHSQLNLPIMDPSSPSTAEPRQITIPASISEAAADVISKAKNGSASSIIVGAISGPAINSDNIVSTNNAINTVTSTTNVPNSHNIFCH